MAIHANSTGTSRGHRPSLIYTIDESERIARDLVLDRRYGPIEAAFAAAQYLDPDPAFWLEQAGLAGGVTELRGERINHYAEAGRTPEFEFLLHWLMQGKGGKPLKRLLEQRRDARDRTGGRP